MSEERRKFVRVSAECMVSFRIVDNAANTHLMPERYDPISSNEISDIATKIRAAGNENDKLHLELLLWLDWKVNYLIKTLIKDKDAPEFPYEAEVVDLSASGARFSSHEQMALGSKIQVRFFLPVLPFNEMVIDGVVCRSRQKESHKSLPAKFDLGVEFTNVKVLDQETIFRYVIKRERQILLAQHEKEKEVERPEIED